ncbi:MAG: hypothetical protein QF805_07085 [Pirellulaceae bacterium]|nr:hypothetical protein [Pirellulaceae bacterium]
MIRRLFSIALAGTLVATPLAATPAHAQRDQDQRLNQRGQDPPERRQLPLNQGRFGQPGPPPGFGGPAGFHLMTALDVNRDGKLSSKEVANAVAALTKLDKNRDGKLSAAEIGWPPPFGRGRGGFPGFGPDRGPGGGRVGGQGGRGPGDFGPGRNPGSRQPPPDSRGGNPPREDGGR